MFHGRNTGKKARALTIIRQAFEIVHLLTGENPLAVLVAYTINSTFIEQCKSEVPEKISPNSEMEDKSNNRPSMSPHLGESMMYD